MALCVSLVELKVSSFKENKSGSLSMREPLILIMIDYFQVVNETFEELHPWNKSNRLEKGELTTLGSDPMKDI